MRIGIIGAGRIGHAMAILSMKHNHTVMISNSRGPETLAAIATETGCAAGTVAQAAAFGDVIVVAIPFGRYQTLPAMALTGKIIIDTNNYYPTRDGAIERLDRRETTTSEMLAEHLSTAMVIKAFNAILASDLIRDSRPAGSSERRALPIAGNDARAQGKVAELMDQFGFDPLDAGTLSESWRFERAKPGYCIPLNAEDMRKALAAAERSVEVEEGSWRR